MSLTRRRIFRQILKATMRMQVKLKIKKKNKNIANFVYRVLFGLSGSGPIVFLSNFSPSTATGIFKGDVEVVDYGTIDFN